MITGTGRLLLLGDVALLLSALSVLSLAMLLRAFARGLDQVDWYVAVYSSAIAASCYAACLLPIINAMVRDQLRLLMVIALMSGSAALVAWLLVIWVHWDLIRLDVFPAAMALSVLPVVSVPISLLAVMRTDHGSLRIARWIVYGLLLVPAVLAVMFLLVHVFEHQLDAAPQSMLGLLMLGWSLSMLSGTLGLVGTPIVAALIANANRRQREARETVGRAIEVRMSCPHCRRTETFAANGRASTCSACSRSVMIDVEEPRCECGYLLYQLRSETCPECGRAIEPIHRWERSPSTSPADEAAEKNDPGNAAAETTADEAEGAT